MKTCTGKEIKNPPKMKRSKEFEGKEWDDIYAVMEAQREAQGNHRTPRPLAIHPVYCRAYCEGFTIAKRIFSRKVKQ